MSDYSKTTDFTAKDSLNTGDPLKLIKGSLYDTEFDAIAVASATKYDSGNLSNQSQAETGTNNTTLMTPLRVDQVLEVAAGMLGDIKDLTDTNSDRLLGWDDSASGVAQFQLGAGLSFGSAVLDLASAVAGAGLTMTSQVLNVIGGDGIDANANDIAVSSSIAGTSLTFASGVINATAATTSAKGTVERATQAEVDAESDTTRYVTPATLAAKPFNNVMSFAWSPPDITRTMTNQSTALQFFDNVPEFRTKIDLSSFTQARLISHVKTAGFSGSYHEARYLTSFSGTVGDYLTLGSSPVRNVHTSAGMIDTGWIDLVAGAKIDNAFLALVMDDGNDTADPSMEQVTMYFR